MAKKLGVKDSLLLDKASPAGMLSSQGDTYQSRLEATNLSPDDPSAWYLRSQVAPSLEERLMCLSRACSLDPDFRDAKNELYVAVQSLLDREPFLAYVHETEYLYQVRSGRDLLINIPKNRIFEKPYLQREKGMLKPAFVWLTLSLLALFLGGVGAFFLAPISALRAMLLMLSPLSRSDRAQLWILLVISVIIWFFSIPFSLLFLIRFFS